MEGLLKHPTKREGLYKFLLLLATLVGYFLYLYWKYDFVTGGLVAGLTWSFFVLCTPVADAGFLLDFPIRLLTGLRMFIIEIFVWVFAVVLNLTVLHFAPETYRQTLLTSLFHKILITPWHYWSIIFLCAMGTFLSIRFGDEMMDVMMHKDRAYHHRHNFKYKIIAMVSFILLVVWAYYHLIETLGVTLP